MFKTILKVVLVAVFLVTAQYATVHAGDRARHDKLTTESATVVAKGQFEIDLGYAYMSQISTRSGAFNDNWGTTRRSSVRTHDADIALTYGLMEDMDITARLGWADIKDRSRPFNDTYGRGIKDVEVEAKYRFYTNTDTGLSFAYSAGLGIPVGKESRNGKLRVGQKSWSFNQKLAMTKDWETVTMNADVGYQLPFGRNRDHYSRPFCNRGYDTRGVLDSNVALGYVAFEHLQPVVELNYAHEWISKGNDSDLISATAGAIVPLANDNRLRVGVQRAIAGRNAVKAYTVMAGYAVTF
jgi:hypothetical protein